MPRLLFEKTGNAVWISHLDLMRLFQRAFKRAGLPLTHTHGFNPRPSVSIALPLSVGTSSACELLDFDLDAEAIAYDEIAAKLNAALVDGVTVRKVYGDGRKLRELSLLQCVVSMEYLNGIPEGSEAAIQDLFSRESLLVEKKTKNGLQEQDIIPMIRRILVNRKDCRIIELNALICCQNPTLNPQQLASAVATYLPDMAADFVRCSRIELFDQQEVIFR